MPAVLEWLGNETTSHSTNVNIKPVMYIITCKQCWNGWGMKPHLTQQNISTCDVYKNKFETLKLI